jgi:hypothetical protein
MNIEIQHETTRPQFVMITYDFLDVVARDLKPVSFMVYAMLLRYAGSDRTCWPSLTKLATQCGVSVNTVRSAFDELVAHRLIQRTARRTARGTQTSDLIVILAHETDHPMLARSGERTPKTLNNCTIEQTGDEPLSKTASGERTPKTLNNCTAPDAKTACGPHAKTAHELDTGRELDTTHTLTSSDANGVARLLPRRPKDETMNGHHPDVVEHCDMNGRIGHEHDPSPTVSLPAPDAWTPYAVVAWWQERTQTPKIVATNKTFGIAKKMIEAGVRREDMESLYAFCGWMDGVDLPGMYGQIDKWRAAQHKVSGNGRVVPTATDLDKARERLRILQSGEWRNIPTDRQVFGTGRQGAINLRMAIARLTRMVEELDVQA